MFKNVSIITSNTWPRRIEMTIWWFVWNCVFRFSISFVYGGIVAYTRPTLINNTFRIVFQGWLEIRFTFYCWRFCQSSSLFVCFPISLSDTIDSLLIEKSVSHRAIMICRIAITIWRFVCICNWMFIIGLCFVK